MSEFMDYSTKDLAEYVRIAEGFKINKNKNIPGNNYILESSFTGNSFFSVFDFRIINYKFVSPSVKAILGYTSDEIIEKGLDFLLPFIHPEDILRHKIIHQEMLSSFYSLNIKDKLKYRYSSDYRIKRSDGKYIRLMDQHNCLGIDDHGKPILDLIVSTDISSYKTDNRMIYTISKYDEKKSEFTDIHHNYLTEYKNGILTKREIEILDLINLGLLNKDISGRLNLSLNTIKTHRKNIKKKIKQLIIKA